MIQKARTVMVDEAGKSEREGVTNILNSLAAHSCLDATIGAEIYKRGYSCGFIAGASQSIAFNAALNILKKLVTDEAEALQHAEACATPQQKWN